MSDHFRTIAKRLRAQVQGPVCKRIYGEAYSRHDALLSYPELSSVLAVLDEETDDFTERDLITQALLREHMAANRSQWSAVLTVAYLPMLLRLRRHLVCVELPSDDLDQIVLEGFLSAINAYRPASWRIQVPIRLTHHTRRCVFQVMRRELFDRKCWEQEREVVRLSPGQVPPGVASSMPLTIREEAVLEVVKSQVSQQGAALLMATEFGRENLRKMVATMIEDKGEQARVYQRLKRARSRARKKLVNAISLSPH